MCNLNQFFGLENKVAVITGGAGLLGERHAEAIALANGIPVLADIDYSKAIEKASALSEKYPVPISALVCDVTDEASVSAMVDSVIQQYGKIDILINNAAIDPKVPDGEKPKNHLHEYSLMDWQNAVDVGLTGAFLCSKVVGTQMRLQQSGVILNIASDLSVIAPDQRIYRGHGECEADAFIKPISYSVVKHGIIGLTKWLATYYGPWGVRANALSPAGVYNGQDPIFVSNFCKTIPMGRMAGLNEYMAAVIFLCSDASSYMTGANVIMDGGRSSW